MPTAVATVHSASSPEFETPELDTTDTTTGAALVLQPAVMVIFGATGDLTARKLMPALLALDRGGYLPPELAIVGVGRRDKTDDQFRADVQKALTKFSPEALG